MSVAPAEAAVSIAARLDRLPSTRAVWRLVLLISLGGVFEFYDLFFTGYVAPAMQASGLFRPDSLGVFGTLRVLAISGFGTFVFCTFLGLWVGILLLSRLADRCGRRTVFTWSLVWYALTTAVMALQRSGEAINLWRFLAGIGFGMQLVTIDTYLSELVPAAMRGRAFAVNQFITFTAVPVVALLAWLLAPQRLLGLEGWRWVVLIGSSGAVVVWLLRARLPESPRWLALHGRLTEAEQIVAQLERCARREVGAALAAPPQEVPDTPGTAGLAGIFAPGYAARTVMLSVFNIAQVIGFYGFASWVPSLLMGRGVTVTDSLEYSFIIAIANPIGPLLGTLFADRVERKTQIIAGLLLMGVFMGAFAVSSAPALLIGLGAGFTLASNVMSYAYHGYQAELYPTRIRARAVGFVYSWSRLAGAFAGLTIGYLLRGGGVALVAAFIGAAMLLGIAVIGLFGPRTRGLALEQSSR